MKPQRIQLRRTKGWRMPPNTVKVDRTTKWGNPFKVGQVYLDYSCEKLTRPMTALAVVQSYSNWVHDMPGKVEAIKRELRGKNLACWCRPGAPCHGDILLEIANS